MGPASATKRRVNEPQISWRGAAGMAMNCIDVRISETNNVIRAPARGVASSQSAALGQC